MSVFLGFRSHFALNHCYPTKFIEKIGENSGPVGIDIVYVFTLFSSIFFTRILKFLVLLAEVRSFSSMARC